MVAPHPLEPAGPVDPDRERALRAAEDRALRAHRMALAHPVLRKFGPAGAFHLPGQTLQPEIQDLEKIFDYSGNQELPLSWWLDQTPEDLRLVADPENDDLLRSMYTNAQVYAREEYALRYPTRDAQLMAQTASLPKAAPAARVADEIAEGVLRPLGWLLGKASWGLVEALDLAVGAYSRVFWDTRTEVAEMEPSARWNLVSESVNKIYQEEAELAYRHYLEAAGLENPEDVKMLSEVARAMELSAGATPADLQRYMEQKHPQRWNEIVKAYGLGDSATAAQIFWQELEDQSQRTELVNLGRHLEETERQFLRDLDEVGPGEKVLSVLSWYGRMVPGRFATYIALFTRDIERTVEAMFEGELYTPELLKYEEEASKVDYRPSAVFGLEDTLVGIGLDLFSMTTMDPITWLFAPAQSMKAARGVTGSAEWLTARARSPVGVRLAQEMVENIRYPAKGSRTYAALLDDFSAIGLREDMVEAALGGVDRALLDRARETRALYAPKPWRQESVKAFELSWKKLDEIFDGELTRHLDEWAAQRGKAGEVAAEEAWQHPLVREGIPKPIPINLRREGDELVIEVGGLGAGPVDETLDLLADARRLGFPRVPVEVRSLITDSGELAQPMGKGVLTRSAERLREVLGADPEEVALFGKSRVGRWALLDDVDEEAVLKTVERALLAGARFNGPSRVLRSMGFSEEVYRAGRDSSIAPSKFVSLLQRWMTPENTTVSYRLTSVRTDQQIRHTILRLYGHDPEEMERWLFRFDDMVARRRQEYFPIQHTWQRYQGVKAELAELEQDMLAETGKLLSAAGPDGSSAASVDDGARTLLQDKEGRLQELRQELQELERRLEDMRPKRNEWVRASMEDYHEFLNELWENFNRKYIASTGLYPVDEETGLVLWDNLRPGRPVTPRPPEPERQLIPEELFEAYKKLLAGRGDKDTFEPELLSYSGRNLHTTAERWTWTAPLSVLDMLAATTPSRAKVLAWTKRAVVESVRQQLWNAIRVWLLDKVARPATALVASGDELLRFFRLTGWEGFKTWVRDKALLLEASAKAVRTPLPEGLNEQLSATGRMLARLDPYRAYYPEGSWKASRLKTLREYSSVLKEAERQVYEMIGDAPWAVLRPGDPGFLEAAERWATVWYADEGFQYVIMDDFDGFRTWFETHPNAHSWRKTYEGDIVNGKYTLQDVYENWRWFFDRVMLAGSAKAGRKQEAVKAWRTAVERVRNSGGRAEHITLPGWVLHDLPAVYGTQRIAQGTPALQQMTNKMFDALFMSPTNYRRGLFSETLFRNERERLLSLYKSRGMEVVSDIDWHRRLTQVGLTVDPVTDPGYTRMWTLMEKVNAVPMGFVEQLARNHADDMVEDLMFKWHRSTRLGRTLAAKMNVPFGGPWADMAGWWARHIATPPIRRGFLANTKRLAFLENIPVNPQALAFLSRLAATDVTAERGIIGEGGFQVDVGPALFLPTASETPFSTLLPGGGPLPSVLVPFILEVLFDPIKDPSGFRAAMEEISQFFPALEFGTTEALPKLVGGGWFATVGRAASSLSAILYGERIPWIDRATGDLTGQLNTSLRVKALLGAPGAMEDLLQQDFERGELALLETLSQAYLQAGASQHAELFIRQMLPVRVKTLNDQEEIADVWIRLGKEFAPDLLPAGWETRYGDSPEDKRELADEIREAFFSLPQRDQEILILRYPGITVNLIPSWEWTPKAKRELPHQTAVPYRIPPGTEGLDLHRNYQKSVYIEPIPPAKVAALAVGRYFEARDRVGRELYALVAEEINRQKWQFVSNETREKVSWMFQNYGDTLGVKSEEELFMRWSSLEKRMKNLLAKDFGLDEDIITLSLPTKDEPWSTDWRGLDEESFSKRFRELNMQELRPFLSEDTFRLAEALGIDLEEISTGEQFVNAIQAWMGKSWVDHPMILIVQPQYEEWKQGRSIAENFTTEWWQRTMASEYLNDDWKEGVRDFLFEVSRDQYYQNRHGHIAPERIALVREKFNQLVNSSLDVVPKESWEAIWNFSYSRMYGPFDWTPPVPPNIEEVESERIDLVLEVHAVPDGDTLYVRSSGSGDTIFSVRLLGVDAPEIDKEPGAEAARERLVDKLVDAVRQGKNVYLVVDPEVTGRRTVDPYGRRLAWLFFDDEAYYFPEEVRP